MPVHHSARDINFVSISSPVGTQIPQAVGTAMAARIAGKDDVALTYFGDGATSTGAFHVSCNFAAVRKAPCIFLCRNNGWAISSPKSVQTATPTFAQKAVAYGMPGVLVDGNDVLALAAVTAEAVGPRPARRGADADRGPHLPARGPQLVGRSLGVPGRRASPGSGRATIRSPASAATWWPSSCGPTTTTCGFAPATEAG